MSVLRLLIRAASTPYLAVLFTMAAIVCRPALAQPVIAPALDSPLIHGPSEPRPELLEPALDTEQESFEPRSLPRIHIPEEEPDASALSGGTISIREFRFSGNTAHTDEALTAATRPYLGEGRRYSALLEARDRVTRLYIDSGYISSGAVLPVQDFSNGVVEFTIVEGRLTEIEVETDGRLRERYFTSRLDSQDRSLNVNELRERLRRLKRDPRVDAIEAELIPGDELGESVLSIVVDETTPYWSAASFDNYTPESIGGLRGYFRAGHRNLTGWGETLSAAYGVAEGLHDIDVRIEAPITRWDTTLKFSLRRAWTEIVEDAFTDEADFKLENRTEAYGFRIEQPVLRRRGEEAGVFFAGEWKRGRTYIAGELGFPGDPNGGKSTVAVLRTGADYLLRLQHRAIAVRITANLGIDALDATGATDPLDGDAPDSEFVTGLIQLQEVEYLPWYEMRIQSRLDAQVTDGRVPSLEQFALGGSSSVRGFRENLAVRDQGVVGSVELRVPLPLVEPIERLELGIFTDAGYGRYRNENRVPATLVSLGFGLHADITSYARASLEWAYDLKESGTFPGNELQDDGLHFSLQFRFP